MIKDLKIGDVIGIYEVLNTAAQPTQDGHKQIHVRCIQCGLEKDIRPVNLGAKLCNHKQMIIPRYCKCCGGIIPFTEKTKIASYKQREFCGSSCAAKINNKRPHSEASKIKASETALVNHYGESQELYEAKRIAKKERVSLARLIKNSSQYYAKDFVEGKDFIICPYCNLRFGQIQGSHLKIHKKTLDDLFTDFGADYKIISDKTYEKKVIAGKAVQQRLLAEGIHKGWQSRNTTSYAEQFWLQVLDNNNIKYQREVPVKHANSNYFLDFVIEQNGKLIDLEIDGKQHTYTDRKESDVVRDLYLTKQGYLVYRVAWNEVNSDAGSNEMKEKIAAFLTFYNSL